MKAPLERRGRNLYQHALEHCPLDDADRVKEAPDIGNNQRFVTKVLSCAGARCQPPLLRRLEWLQWRFRSWRTVSSRLSHASNVLSKFNRICCDVAADFLSESTSRERLHQVNPRSVRHGKRGAVTRRPQCVAFCQLQEV